MECVHVRTGDGLKNVSVNARVIEQASVRHICLEIDAQFARFEQWGRRGEVRGLVRDEWWKWGCATENGSPYLPLRFNNGPFFQ